MGHARFTTSDFDLPSSPLLLIDDRQDNLALLRNMLEWSGFDNIHCCSCAKDGIAAMGSVEPHLIIVDLHMPAWTALSS